jgi:hypothetical protein
VSDLDEPGTAEDLLDFHLGSVAANVLFLNYIS